MRTDETRRALCGHCGLPLPKGQQDCDYCGNRCEHGTEGVLPFEFDALKEGIVAPLTMRKRRGRGLSVLLSLAIFMAVILLGHTILAGKLRFRQAPSGQAYWMGYSAHRN